MTFECHQTFFTYCWVKPGLWIQSSGFLEGFGGVHAEFGFCRQTFVLKVLKFGFSQQCSGRHAFKVQVFEATELRY